MKYGPVSKSMTFLVELTVVILVFAFTSALSIGLFAGAHKVGTSTGDMNIASLKVQSLAETAKYAESPEAMSKLADPTAWPQYFDKDWNNVEFEETSIYIIDVAFSKESKSTGIIASAIFTASATRDDAKPIFELEVQKYYPGN